MEKNQGWTLRDKEKEKACESRGVCERNEEDISENKSSIEKIIGGNEKSKQEQEESSGI